MYAVVNVRSEKKEGFYYLSTDCLSLVRFCNVSGVSCSVRINVETRRARSRRWWGGDSATNPRVAYSLYTFTRTRMTINTSGAECASARPPTGHGQQQEGTHLESIAPSSEHILYAQLLTVALAVFLLIFFFPPASAIRLTLHRRGCALSMRYKVRRGRKRHLSTSTLPVPHTRWLSTRRWQRCPPDRAPRAPVARHCRAR